MLRISAGLAICLAAVVTGGCGTVPAPHSGSAAHAAVPALAAIPGAVMAKEVNRASFAAVRPGRVMVTSVRPPCQVAVPTAKSELEPGFQLPKVYPLRSCPPGHRFSALVIVRR